MPDFSQETRRSGVLTPLGQDAVVLQSFSGLEEISQLFSYELRLLSDNDTIQAEDLIAQPITFWVLHPDDDPRFFHGFANRFEYLGRGDRGSLYRINVVPWFWFATQNRECRIFQELSIPDIINELFQSRGYTEFEMNLSGSYPTIEYCVQYNESDYAFCARLMEEAGIFYYFRHDQSGHKMILGDSPGACYDCKDERVSFSDKLSERTIGNDITQWNHTYEFRPGRWAHEDFNFKSPQNDMVATTNTTMSLPRVQDYEVYEYPGRYAVKGDGQSLAYVRLQAEEARHNMVAGASSARSFSPGARFTISKHHSQREQGKSYVVTAVKHTMDASSQYVSGGAQSDGYSNEFNCIPADTPYRPARTTPVPRVYGPQTAIVVGPAAEEIYTDEFGRVKVQFHWDRYGELNEHSSCWMRVSQVHAGKSWGMMDLPRIGEEVIVDFLNGDPDRPIITGRVYNGENMPPFALPAGKTRRGNMTKTYKGAGFNEMSMDDTPGKEQLRMNAMYNMNSNVNNDQTLDVGNNQTEKVAVDRSRQVGNNETVKIGVNQETSVGTDKKTTVGANHTENVAANQSVSVGANQSNSVGSVKNETVGMMSNESAGVAKTLNVGVANSVIAGAMMNTAVGFMNTEQVGMVKKINVGSKLEISCGASKLTMDAGGNVTISGTAFNFTASGAVKINGAIIDLN